jgi:hypothetical protein
VNHEPFRWWKATTLSGKPAGLGFQCYRCGLGYRHSAPQKIDHCGRVESAPFMTLLLPSFSIVDAPRFPSNLVPVGWHGDEAGGPWATDNEL